MTIKKYDSDGVLLGVVTGDVLPLDAVKYSFNFEGSK